MKRYITPGQLIAVTLSDYTLWSTREFNTAKSRRSLAVGEAHMVIHYDNLVLVVTSEGDVGWVYLGAYYTSMSQINVIA